MKGGNGTSKVTQGVKGKRLISSFKRLHGGIQLQNGALRIRCLRARRVVSIKHRGYSPHSTPPIPAVWDRGKPVGEPLAHTKETLTLVSQGQNTAN